MDSSQVKLTSHCYTLGQLHVLTASPFFSCVVPQLSPCYLHPLVVFEKCVDLLSYSWI